MSSFEFCVHHEGRLVVRLPVERLVMRLGRDPESDVVLDSHFVSWKHARVEVRDADYVLVGEGSHNGTLLNGKRVSDPTKLKPGDEIRIADFVLHYRRPEPHGTQFWDASMLKSEEISQGLHVPDAAPTAAEAGLRTILFTDLASSTALTQRLGDAKAQELVRAHNAIVREALKTHSGAEIKHTGDGIMASFPTASGALDCAIAIQRAVKEDSADKLAVRIGLNAGEPVAEESDLFGTAVQLARRICDHAEAGQILVSNVVRELVAGKGFLFSDIGEVAPKGFEEPVRLYEVHWRD